MAFVDFALLAAFLAMLCHALGDFFIQRSVRKVGNLESLAIISLFGFLAVTPFVLSDWQLIFQPANLFVLFSVSIVTLFAAILNFEALRAGKLSVIEALMQFELPATVLLGFFLFGESLSQIEVALIALVFAGLFFVSLESLSFSSIFRKVEKGAAVALASAIGLALVNFLTAQASKQVSPFHAIWLPWLLLTIYCVAYLWKKGSLTIFYKNSLLHGKTVLAMAFFDSAAWILFAMAVAHAELSIMGTITQSYPVAAMALGVLVNKEKVAPHQLLFGALTIGATIALGFVSG